MTAFKYCGLIFVLIVLVALYFLIPIGLVVANDHESEHKDFRRNEIREKYDNEHGKIRKQRKDNDGNETTGQFALWLLVAANLTIVLSLIMKGLNRVLPLDLKTKELIKNVNRRQKKYLMKLHYFLNPFALCIALFHFLISSCRSSAIPELGLILILITAILGLMLKYNISPKRIKKKVYFLHTSPVTFSTVILVLFTGHMIID